MLFMQVAHLNSKYPGTHSYTKAPSQYVSRLGAIWKHRHECRQPTHPFFMIIWVLGTGMPADSLAECCLDSETHPFPFEFQLMFFHFKLYLTILKSLLKYQCTEKHILFAVIMHIFFLEENIFQDRSSDSKYFFFLANIFKCKMLQAVFKWSWRKCQWICYLWYDTGNTVFILTWCHGTSGTHASPVTERCGISYSVQAKPISVLFWSGDD